ncbi:WecB/TagA/CpsF family glycosyltransferase [Sphingomonas sp. Leaf339]|uniref:WecB/TagA/CpsF family glycosyltransferase n=1 Tax=Sphingomonas sp. Leaf339 TaxID=1736343 RepID=UPI00138EF17A|nr:WecB/TagA/CpsF family glycosyltransferase [Sphingomonas sp. Leaf339]
MNAPFSTVDFTGVVRQLRTCRTDAPFRYVVTPNVDHLVRLSREPRLLPLYERSWLSLCDGRIAQRLARILGHHLGLVSGSDLVAAMFAHIIEAGDRICVVGGSAGMVEALGLMRPDIAIDHVSPPMGLAHDEDARNCVVMRVAGERYRYIFLAVGSPQQEMIAAEMMDAETVTGTALCVGGGLDYVTGHKRRAPLIVQRVGLEFVWRIAEDPRRLWRRYLQDGPAILIIAFKWALAGKSDGHQSRARSNHRTRD